jgi:hypothetical protein
MGDWCGACYSDTINEDITGAMFVATMGEVYFYAVFSRDSFRLLTGAG